MSQPSGSDCFADEYAPRVVRAALYCMEPSNNSDGALITESLVTLNSVVSIVDPILINQEFSFILPQLQTFFDTVR
jgi:hypothetical protein